MSFASVCHIKKFQFFELKNWFYYYLNIQSFLTKINDFSKYQMFDLSFFIQPKSSPKRSVELWNWSSRVLVCASQRSKQSQVAIICTIRQPRINHCKKGLYEWGQSIPIFYFWKNPWTHGPGLIFFKFEAQKAWNFE